MLIYHTDTLHLRSANAKLSIERVGCARFARGRCFQGGILEDYPYLEAVDIAACLAYAASEADHPVLLAR
ncbi:MAG TPA: DUF433 domain-containing protein [Verrucomicrobiales bacterium]|nr:DUF433 domain-containing protein [Verrucomicrobiales bacterium]HIL69797.1 DUF433 domain-containing protein [Verrucomicrobiota bacterium]